MKHPNIEIQNLLDSLSFIKSQSENNIRRYFETESVVEVPPVAEPVIQQKVESKETFSEVKITDPDLLEKIAQLEAIDSSGNFNQEKYAKYLADEVAGKHGNSSVTQNQKKALEAIAEGESIEDFGYTLDTIYGEGGWNRYAIDAMTGEIKLSEAKDQASGGEQYREILKAKARELGIKVGT